MKPEAMIPLPSPPSLRFPTQMPPRLWAAREERKRGGGEWGHKKRPEEKDPPGGPSLSRPHSGSV